ncbi:MAG: hypothetical protein R2875_14485 [Desulfobacterales bacterium]
MKPIWLTSLDAAQDPVKQLMSALKPYGLDIQGHFWKDDLKNMAWMAAVEHLVDSNIPVWVILASAADLKKPDILYGLSMAAISVQAKKGIHFPLVILQAGPEPISEIQLPTPLKQADILPASGAGLGAKLVAKAHTSPKPAFHEYFVDIHGNPQIGLWFEVRPVSGSWPGIMFGVNDAEITFQAAGPAGRLPDKSVLNYPVQGMKINLGDTPYTAWATRNELNDATSYFVKVEGFPRSLLFGPYSEENLADAYVLHLK